MIELAGINEYSSKKMSRNESVSAEVFCKVSKALHCTIDEIVEYSDEGEPTKNEKI